MPRPLQILLKMVLSLSIAGAFLWAAFGTVDLDELFRTLRQAKLPWLGLTSLLFLASNLARARRWQILMAPLTREVGLWRAWLAIGIGYAGNNLVPRSGEFARVVAVRRGNPVPVTGLLATVLVERILDLLSLLVLFGFVLGFARKQIAQAFPWMERAGLIAFAASLLLLGLFAALSAYGERVLPFVERLVGRASTGLASRLTNMLGTLFQGMEAVRTPGGYAEIAATTLALNALYVLTVYVPFLSFGLDAAPYGLGFSASVVVLVIATIGVIIPTPGGAGTYHYFCSKTLHHLYGVPLTQAVAYATAVHGVAYLTFLLVGGPGLLSLFWRRPDAAGSSDPPGPGGST